MAAIDKTYVNKEQLLEAIEWAKGVDKATLENGSTFYPLDFIYGYNDLDDPTFWEKEREVYVLWNTPIWYDRWLWLNCPLSFVRERLQEQYDEEEARKLQKKIAKNEYNFEDFLAQINQIKKMGNVKDLLNMIPGMSKLTKDVEIGDDAFKNIEAIIGSMTPYERRNPSVINGSRRMRIASGSGNSIQEVNRLLKQFEETRKVMKMVSSSNGRGLGNMMRRRKR